MIKNREVFRTLTGEATHTVLLVVAIKIFIHKEVIRNILLLFKTLGINIGFLIKVLLQCYTL